jgi:hypothetical protein
VDCPTCGAASPAEDATCVCGHEFQSIRFPATPDWEISLAWRQKVAAYWSISWPAEVVWFLVLSAVNSRYATPEEVAQHVGSINLSAYLSFFAIQSLLTHRLVRKNYRSFRIYVVHPNGQQSRRLSLRESLWVGLCLVVYQISFIVALILIVVASGNKLAPLIALEVWLRFFVAGPYGIALALRVRYPGFRLRASGFRYI